MCMWFLNTFLEFAAKNATVDDLAYVVDFVHPFTHFRLRQDTSGQFNFLPSWYQPP